MKYLVELIGTKRRCKEWVEVEAKSAKEAEEKAESGYGSFVEEESGTWEDYSVLSVEEYK